MPGVVSSGQEQGVEDQQTTMGVVVEFGGIQYIEGGNPSGTIVQSGGAQVVEPIVAPGEEQGAAHNTVVQSGGLLVVDSEAILDGATIDSGGYLVVLSDGFTQDVTFEPGAIVVSGGVVQFSAANGVTVSPGNVAEIQVPQFGFAVALNGATVTDATVSGSLSVTSGARAVAPTVAHFGVIGIGAGGEVDGGVVYGSLGVGAAASDGSAPAGEADEVTVGATGTMYVAGVSQDSLVAGYLFISSGGVAYDTHLVSGGRQVVGGGAPDNPFGPLYAAFDSGAVISAGASESVGQLGESVSASVLSGGLLQLGYIGLVEDVDIKAGGRLEVDEGGVFSTRLNTSVTFNSATDQLTFNNVETSDFHSSYVVQLAGDYTGETFSSAVVGSEFVVTVVPACYARGTLIATVAGERAVESLAPGDQVVAASGPVRPIRWIGRRSYAGRFLRANPDVWPIRFRAGSLGEGLPRRDLLISPEHAMFLDGVLVPADCLVDGIAIVREASRAEVEYFHVELDSHDVILAEGAPSESFADDGSADRFHNAADRPPPLAEPGQFCAPRVTHGPALQSARARLRRAATRDAARNVASN